MEIQAPTKRVAAYLRVSTEEQKVSGLSVEAQRQAIEDWAQKEHVRIMDFYNDAGISARKKHNKRPELLRLLDDVKEKRVDLIVFTKLDRWFRNIAEYYKVQEILEANGVNWKAIHEDYETLTSSGRLKINIMLSVAQDEADRDSERIKAVFEAKKARLEPVTGHVPTGYRIVDKKIVKDHALEPAISLFFESFLQYFSVRKSQDVVEEAFGVIIPYKLASSMLSKEAYFGRFHGVNGMCPAYISEKDFERIQDNRRKVERKTLGDRTYLFSGLLFCSECGRRLGARAKRYSVRSGGFHERVAYNCPGRYFQNDCTNSINIGEKDIEAFLLANADQALNDYLTEIDRLSARNFPRRNYKEERAKIKKKLAKLKDLYVDDIIELDLYKKDYEDLTVQLEAIDQEEKAISPPPDPSPLIAKFSPGWQDIYKDLSKADKQSFWRMSIDKITVRPSRKLSFSFRF